MRYFCTYFDRRYLARGLSLYESLSRHCQAFTLWVLCMDRETLEALQEMQLADLRLIPLTELEGHDERLHATKENRSLIEYYFTCTASLVLFVLERNTGVNLITYLDADLCFFSTPEPLFEELGASSVAITSHRFPRKLSKLEIYGLYNVAFLSFRRDANGLTCLHWWRERCLEWCYDREEDGRFADQKYLDQWPARFPGVAVFQHKGANLAPWNVDNYKITKKDDEVVVDDEKLIFFHFHGLRRLGKYLFDLNLAMYRACPTRILLQQIFAPYIRLCRRHERTLSASFGSRSHGGPIRILDKASGPRPKKLASFVQVLKGNYVMLVGDRFIAFPRRRQRSD